MMSTTSTGDRFQPADNLRIPLRTERSIDEMSNKQQLTPVATYSYTAQTESEVIGTCDVKFVSFNILAPCYNSLSSTDANPEPTKSCEPKEEYMDRNNKIIDELLKTDADIICIQEFWSGSEDIRQLYQQRMCAGHGPHVYTLKELRRTSRWRSRDDGLAIFVREHRVVIQDFQDIRFHDCGDRVAQMLLLAVKPELIQLNSNSSLDVKDIPHQQFICVNTHLLFPHNEYSSNIRLREMTKILVRTNVT